jgi:hypothetical protein
VVGGDPGAIFTAMNRHLASQPYTTAPCENFSHAELNNFARVLFHVRSPALANIYDERGDKRKFHFETNTTDGSKVGGLEYKEALWDQEARLGAANPAVYGDGTVHYAMVRDGKCAEAVMWWIHHLTEKSRVSEDTISTLFTFWCGFSGSTRFARVPFGHPRD